MIRVHGARHQCISSNRIYCYVYWLVLNWSVKELNGKINLWEKNKNIKGKSAVDSTYRHHKILKIESFSHLFFFSLFRYRKQCGQAVLDVLKEQPLADILQHIRQIASTISMAAEDTGKYQFRSILIDRILLLILLFIVVCHLKNCHIKMKCVNCGVRETYLHI